MEDKEYKAYHTSDTALASYLQAMGMKVVGTVTHQKDPNRKVFVFVDTPERDKLVENYLTGNDLVSASYYARTYKITKRFLYEDDKPSTNIQG